jgi:hypothetical protein
MRVDYADTFMRLWDMLAGDDVPRPLPEYRFAPPRKWRADAAFVGYPEKLVEVGGF